MFWEQDCGDPATHTCTELKRAKGGRKCIGGRFIDSSRGVDRYRVGVAAAEIHISRSLVPRPFLPCMSRPNLVSEPDPQRVWFRDKTQPETLPGLGTQLHIIQISTPTLDGAETNTLSLPGLVSFPDIFHARRNASTLFLMLDVIEGCIPHCVPTIY